MQKSYLVPLAEPPASDRMSFVTVMNFVLRNLRFMGLTGLVVAVVSPLPLIGRPPTYASTMRFVTEAEQPAGRFLGDLELPGTAGRGPGFYIDLLKSPVVLEALAKAPLQLAPGDPPTTLVQRYTGQPHTNAEAVRSFADGLAGRITANASGTGIITLKVTADDPWVAAAVARELLVQADAFNETELQSHARRERQFAEERLAVVERELHEAEANWLAFVEQNRVVSAPKLQLQQERMQDSLSRKRATASMLVQAIQRSRLDEVRETPRAVVLSPPLPGSPSHITWQRVALVGFFAGMIIGALIALIRDYFRQVAAQPTPEAQEFAALRAASGALIGRSIRAVLSAVRKPRPTPLR